MARIVVIGGIESTFTNAEVLHNLGEEIVMFFTRGPQSQGWQGVKMIETSNYSFLSTVPITVVNGNINDHIRKIVELQPDFIYSLGWQQMYSPELLLICPVIGIHESLLPTGAGAVPIANAILNNFSCTGATLFWLDGGMDTGPIIGQLKSTLDPRKVTATEIYFDIIQLGGELLKMHVPHINSGRAAKIPQDLSKRTVYKKINWSDWPIDSVKRARVYPYD